METLPPVTLGVTLLIPTAFLRILHPSIERRFVAAAPLIRQAVRQFYMELSLVLLAGVFAATSNWVLWGFPLHSALTLVFGCLIIGFFLALDMSLNRERAVIRDAVAGAPLTKLPQRLYPMTRKFSLVAFTATLFVTLVIGLAVSRDFFWLQQQADAASIEAAKASVIHEIFFIMAILLAYVANLILSYSRNLKLLFENETGVLERVSSGDLSRLVPVATSDEFGIIAGHTNAMIGGLRHRIQLLTELKLAEEVQLSLLPKDPPEVPGLDIAGFSKYCDQTGGDYFDYFPMPDGRLGIVVADAAGHGIGAALQMTTARAFIRFGAYHYGSSTELLDNVNRFLARDSSETGRFLTVFFTLIDPLQKTLRWVRAGHDPAILYDPTREAFEELSGEGTALGVFDNLTFHENSRQGWKPGSIIAIGTDGIWETRNQKGEIFGHRRFLQIIRDHSAESAAGIKLAVLDAVESFQGEAKQEDDITLVVVKLL
jgi:sigma-B regulation protein RsbU (phosphoserine phosphatase)